ncbi:hypothetical protein EYC84_011246 [Monilinia fructicola]|uniref:Uncharacterized protein n=1 Tax=Monilinia fructicola TaxID=38448 RepID=A0A5M9J8Y0_MONFR|nr:hypothetical protein EYC84_011246 [Monilinia fructicola]
MFIPLPESAGSPTREILQDGGHQYMRTAAAIFAQNVHQTSNVFIHKRAEELTTGIKPRDGIILWHIAVIFGVSAFFGILIFYGCRFCCRRIREQERDSSSRRLLSRSRTFDPQSRRTCFSDGPTSGWPTGEMGAARAALGATIDPTPSSSPSSLMQQITHQERDARGRPTGEMGLARAALGATIEPENEGARSDARNVRTHLDDEFVITSPPSVATRPEHGRIQSIATNSDRPLRFQETYLTNENGTQVISRPIPEADSIYSLRPGGSMAYMRRRVDDELHEAVSSYPIFQDSLPKHPSAPEPSPSRATRPTSRFNVDEEVSRQVASFPIFQQNSASRQSMMRRMSEDEELRRRETTTRDEELRRQIAALPMFRNPVAYSPTRRPETAASGSMTPLPAYEHAPAYDGLGESRGVQGEGAHVLRNQGDVVRDEENDGFALANLPPAYVR